MAEWASDWRNSPEYRSLVQGIARSEYQLLIGAGASVGGVGGDGQALPTGNQLTIDLIREFASDLKDENLDLQEATEAILNREQGSGRLLRYLQSRFTHCTGGWQDIICDLPFHRIWSLNIDDLTELAYKKKGLPFQSLSWTDKYIDFDPTRHRSQIIHLHGDATKAQKDNDFIFSISQYLHSVSERHIWHSIFGDVYSTKPFIIIGASLNSELDLYELLKAGTLAQETTGRPSIAVLRSATPFQIERLSSFGVSTLIQDGRLFLETLYKDYQEARKKIELLLPSIVSNNSDESDRLQFLSQWKRLTENRDQEFRSHDFYAGDDPSWNDILDDNDVVFRATQGIVNHLEQIKERQRGQRQIIGCISGPPGSGKSTALRRVGREMLRKGYDVFLFRNEERLNVDLAFRVVMSETNCVFLADGLGDIGKDVNSLASKCRKEGKPLIVIGVERAGRIKLLYGDVEADFLHTEYPYSFDTLAPADIKSLVDKLRDKRRLGALTQLSNPEIISELKTKAQRQLLVSLLLMREGQKLLHRALSEYSADITDNTSRQVYALSCLTYIFGYDLPIAIACKATGITAKDMKTMLQTPGQLEGVLRVEDSGLRPRHRFLAYKVLDQALTADERFALMKSLALALSPYISKLSIRKRTLAFRIARHLFDSNTVIRLVRYKAPEWYESLVQEYSWNSRFWEQRALTELQFKRYERARDYAEEAVRTYDHSYTRTTLATVLMRIASEQYSPGSSESMIAYDQAVENLCIARGDREGSEEYEFTVFFRYSLRIAAKINKASNGFQSIQKAWNEWLRYAENSAYFKHPSASETLAEYKIKWLRAISSSEQ